MNRTGARALPNMLAAMAGVPLLLTGKGASSNLQDERSCLKGGAPNAKNFVPVPMSARKCHQHGASQEAERGRALPGGVLQPTGAGSWHRPRFWKQTRRSEEFIHHRGKCSRASEPLAVDLRPVGAANWPPRGRPECPPYGASAGACVQTEFGPRSGFRMRLVYTSVRMLEGPRSIATFCHFVDGFDDCFGWSRFSATSIDIME
jgi:hypothetical protein